MVALVIAFILGYLLRVLTSSETPASSNNGGGFALVFIAFILGFLLSCAFTMPYSMSEEEIIDLLHYVFGGLSLVIASMDWIFCWIVTYLLPVVAYAVTILFFSIFVHGIFIDKNSNDKGFAIIVLLLCFFVSFSLE